jgi:cysteine desulfurase/selenocysteine lyase
MPDEIIFVRGTTEAINLVAQTFGRQRIGAGDEILLTTMEHHANIVPWKMLSEQTGANIRVAPINDRGELLLDQFASLLSERTKIVAITHVSNALGTINPLEEVIALAHAYGIPVLVDGAQSTPHLPVNVQALDADFFAFSGHKIFGPDGHRHSLWEARISREHPALPGRRQHDRGCHVLKDHLRGHPAEI